MQNNEPMTHTVAEQLEALFEAPDASVWEFTVDVFSKCILNKVRAPEGTMKHRWLQAGTGESYYGMWIWDNMFVIDLLSALPGTVELIREVIQNYWDFQERWNKARPAYAHDMVACMIEPRNTSDWVEYPAYSQIPILAWGIERVFRRNGDNELLRQSLAPLERFHEWYWRERDIADTGLIGFGAYSGNIQHARFETFDFECNLDELRLTPHPKRPGTGDWYGDVSAPGNTAYLVMGEHSLRRMALELGDTAMAERRARRIEKSVAAVRRHMWDEASGCFLSVQRDTLEKIPVPTIGSWIPLTAEIPTQAMADRMAATIQTDNWWTSLPVPTVGRHDPHWNDGKFNNPGGNFWRGDVWPATNYQIATGFANYGYHDIAAGIADRSVANAIRNGLHEHYDCDFGKGLGVPDLAMSCTLVTMMLDGLTRHHRLTQIGVESGMALS